jgi:PPM family protein phosphatase
LATDAPQFDVMTLDVDVTTAFADAGTVADCAAATHGGPQRVHNEDHCLTLMQDATPTRSRRYMLAVADGVGGNNAGEVASETAIETLAARFRAGGPEHPRKWMTQALRAANLAVFDRSHTDPAYRAMQTTLTCVLIQDDEVAVGHVGDSRAYRFREGAVQQLTQDHTHIMDLVRVRLVTLEQAMHHPARHQLTRSLGAEPIVSIDVQIDRAKVGDTYVVCSDGLWGTLSRGNLQRLIGDLPAEAACRQLISLGVTLDAEDNISIGVARIHSLAAAAPRPTVLSRLRSLLWAPMRGRAA